MNETIVTKLRFFERSSSMLETLMLFTDAVFFDFRTLNQFASGTTSEKVLSIIPLDVEVVVLDSVVYIYTIRIHTMSFSTTFSYCVVLTAGYA